MATTFGWVITPAARDAAGAATLHENNRRFIERMRGAFDTLWVEDHFQWGERPVVECWTTMAYLAAQHPDFKIGSLVLGQSYRNPALTAKMFATLHWLTGGRLIAGVGAGWKQDEYESYGWPFPEARTRVEQLEDAVNIIRALWTQSPANYTGKHYAIKDAYCEPRPDPPPPLLIAGGGERLTLRVVARYADWMNVGFCDSETFARKLDALQRHCDDVRRDNSAIRKTYFGFVSVTPNGVKPEPRGDLHIVYGTPDQVFQELKEFREMGVTHFMLRFIDFPKTEGLELFLSQVMPRLTTG
jgi:alkanesulfonate monooxygenase SsuD/methylene tetrahydromethanopterin reductase-like flavin-dependent oxidoreductase (luciferase family)